MDIFLVAEDITKNILTFSSLEKDIYNNISFSREENIINIFDKVLYIWVVCQENILIFLIADNIYKLKFTWIS